MFGALLKALYFAILFGLFALVQWYVSHAYVRWVLRFVRLRHQDLWLRIGVYILVFGNAIFALRFILTQTGYYVYWGAQYLIIYPGAMFFSAMVLIAFIILLYDIPRLIQKISRKIVFKIKSRNLKNSEDFELHEKEKTHSRRKFLKYAGAVAVAAPFAISIATTTRTARDYQINRPELFFEDLPSALDGLRIVQISDIHSGMYMTQSQISEIFEISNSLHPEVVAITGDFVDSAPSEIPAISNAIRDLKSEYGIFGCLGNHDHYASAHEVSDAMQSRGVVMLNNNSQELEINGETLSMIGVDDAGRGSKNYARIDWAMRNINPDTFKILLSHRPEQFHEAIQRDIQLTLAGHTHGGQIGGDVFGVRIYPIDLVYEYTKGLYYTDDKKLYVNVGVGMVGVPIRVVRPEITEITLRKKV